MSRVIKRKTRLLKVLFALATLLIVSDAFGARCTGSSHCRACSSCRYCAHCAKQGGTCGVCSPGVAADSSSSSAPQKADNIPWWVYLIGGWAGIMTISWGWQKYQAGKKRSDKI
jgi:hypothetical protein